jgi:hypothetical protein
MRRRRHGNGGVRQRADGRWDGSLRLAGGSRKYLYAGNRDVLIAKLQEERWRLAYGIPIRSKGLLVSDYLAQWLEVMRSRLRPKTFDSYVLVRRTRRHLMLIHSR